MKSLLAIAALLLPWPLMAGDKVAEVPDQFVGYWAGTPSSCGSDSDEFRLHIDKHHISFWESNGPIKAVVVRGRHELALIAELSGEGEIWLATATFTLSQDGNKLVDDTTGRKVERYRCPVRATRSNNSFKPNPLRGSA